MRKLQYKAGTYVCQVAEGEVVLFSNPFNTYVNIYIIEQVDRDLICIRPISSDKIYGTMLTGEELIAERPKMLKLLYG